MRKLAILTFVSLDGVMQAPKLPEEDSSGGFEHGGWADKYWNEAMALVGEYAMAEPYDLLLGRKTYDLFSLHNSKNPDTPLNGYTKYVATNSLSTLSWQNSIPISGNIAEEIAMLKEKDGLLLQVHGSWELIKTLLKNDLVDEFRLFTFPIILGEGKRLFSDGNFPKSLKLIKSKTTSHGVAMNIYER